MMITNELNLVLRTPGIWKVSGTYFNTWIEVTPQRHVWSLRPADKSRDNILGAGGWSEDAQRGALQFEFEGLRDAQ